MGEYGKELAEYISSNEFREKLLETIFEHEMEKCFDRNFLDDEMWNENEEKTRSEVFQDIVNTVYETPTEELLDNSIYRHLFDEVAKSKYVYNKTKYNLDEVLKDLKEGNQDKNFHLEERYVRDLDPFIQSKIDMELRKTWVENGLDENMIQKNIALAMKGKISDLKAVIDIQGIIREGNEFLNTVSSAKDKVIEVDAETMNCIINSEGWNERGEYSPLGYLYHKDEDGTYIGMDNSTGNAWMEEFESEKDCFRWLNGAELEDGKIVEQAETESTALDPSTNLYNQIENVLESYDFGKADGEDLAIMLERTQIFLMEHANVSEKDIKNVKKTEIQPKDELER